MKVLQKRVASSLHQSISEVAMSGELQDSQTPLKIAFIHPDLGIGMLFNVNLVLVLLMLQLLTF
jgi:hypothetical protein